MSSLLLAIVLSAQAWTVLPARIDHCYDGDTCTATLHLPLGVALIDQKLRLCGINAPELRGRSKGAGKRSRDALLTYLGNADRVEAKILRRTACRVNCEQTGKYGRWLTVLIADGIDLNARLIRDGWAKAAACK